MTVQRCPACYDGNCVNCSGNGGFQVDRPPPYLDTWEVCSMCAGLRHCLVCAGTMAIEVEKVDTNELPLPFSHLPNDVEEWEDIL